MKQTCCIGVIVLLAAAGSADLTAKGKQAQAAQPDMCIVPPGRAAAAAGEASAGHGNDEGFSGHDDV